MIYFGWFRFVCSNGLVIGETKIEIKERHGQSLNLAAMPAQILPALKSVNADCSRMKRWQSEMVCVDEIANWSNARIAQKWGKKAAARVYHICKVGRDIEFEDPFAPGAATEKPIRYLDRIPGSPERAATKYDVSQALSFVATHLSNAEERLARQADIPYLLRHLAASPRRVQSA